MQRHKKGEGGIWVYQEARRGDILVRTTRVSHHRSSHGALLSRFAHVKQHSSLQQSKRCCANITLYATKTYIQMRQVPPKTAKSGDNFLPCHMYGNNHCRLLHADNLGLDDKVAHHLPWKLSIRAWSLFWNPIFGVCGKRDSDDTSSRWSMLASVWRDKLQYELGMACTEPSLWNNNSWKLSEVCAQRK